MRGYLIGSGWKDYQRTGSVCGISLPAGLRQADRLPQVIFTPSSKAPSGEHDLNIDFAAVTKLIGAELAAQVRDASIRVYEFAVEYAAPRGIIIADTKFEFGLDEDGRLLLMDEVLTPDSSRFWPEESYAPGTSPPSYDKQFVRDYLETLDWDKRPPPPPIPAGVIEATAAKYREAYERLTGECRTEFIREHALQGGAGHPGAGRAGSLRAPDAQRRHGRVLSPRRKALVECRRACVRTGVPGTSPQITFPNEFGPTEIHIMRKIDTLLDEYGASHVNRLNKIIHWICVPPIVWTVVALLWSIPFPWEIGAGIVSLNWAVIALLLAQIYYFRLSRRLGMGLMLYNLAMLWLTAVVEANSPWPLWQVALAVFVLAWIGQFIGHVFEGKRPSFFKDLQFLLIGPAWLMSFVYRQVGLDY